MMNFESYDFKDMTSNGIYEYIKSRLLPQKRMYLFFDEIQRVEAWEEAVNALRVDINCDIYITGSNAFLLSSEYSTYLSGRSVEIKMLPLSFAEFIDFHGFEIRESTSALGGTHRRAYDSQGESYELKELFEAYLRFGGMPGIADVGLDQEKALMLLDGIYSTKRKAQRQTSDNRRRTSAQDYSVFGGQYRQFNFCFVHRKYACQRGFARRRQKEQTQRAHRSGVCQRAS